MNAQQKRLASLKAVLAAIPDGDQGAAAGVIARWLIAIEPAMGTKFGQTLMAQHAAVETERDHLRELLIDLRAALTTRCIDGVNIWEHWLDDSGALHKRGDLLLGDVQP